MITYTQSVGGDPIPGAFHADRAQAAASSFHNLADPDAQIACFGHGQPLTRNAAHYFQEAAQQLPGCRQ